VEALTEKTAGRGETLVRVSGAETDILAAVRCTAGVEEVEVLERSRGGVLSLAVRSARGGAVRSHLVRTLVDGGWSVHEVSPRLMSLEDLFVDILERAGRGERSA